MRESRVCCCPPLQHAPLPTNLEASSACKRVTVANLPVPDVPVMLIPPMVKLPRNNKYDPPQNEGRNSCKLVVLEANYGGSKTSPNKLAGMSSGQLNNKGRAGATLVVRHKASDKTLILFALMAHEWIPTPSWSVYFARNCSMLFR